MKVCFKNFSSLLLAVLFISSFVGCSLQLVSKRDEASLQQMEALSQEVDYFFTRLLYLPAAQRDYARSAQGYMGIEVKLKALHMRQQAREMNELTLKQVNIALELWQQDRKRHQIENTLSDFTIKRYRSQYQRVFLAMIKAEQAKE